MRLNLPDTTLYLLYSHRCISRVSYGHKYFHHLHKPACTSYHNKDQGIILHTELLSTRRQLNILTLSQHQKYKLLESLHNYLLLLNYRILKILKLFHHKLLNIRSNKSFHLHHMINYLKKSNLSDNCKHSSLYITLQYMVHHNLHNLKG